MGCGVSKPFVNNTEESTSFLGYYNDPNTSEHERFMFALHAQAYGGT
jgi:hypothetical protein